jgi:hypothetical protein
MEVSDKGAAWQRKFVAFAVAATFRIARIRRGGVNRSGGS